MVDGAPGPESQAGHLHLSPVRALPAGAQRAHADRPRRRPEPAPACPQPLRARGPQSRAVADPRGMAESPAAGARSAEQSGGAAERQLGWRPVARELKLGLNIGYWAGGPPPGTLDSILEAERLGFDSVWTAEAYGSDALVPLAWWGASTTRIRLGTGIVQISARTPAATAMAAMTLDHLSGGRLVLGLGVSGPQVVEGWYGQPFAK